MRKGLLLCVGFLLIVPLFAIAQEQNSTLRAYLEWRHQALARQPLGEATPHYALAATTRRLDTTSAQIDLVIAGKMQGYTLVIQPLRINKLADGTVSQVSVGEVSTMNVNGIGKSDDPNPLSSTSVKVRAVPEANGVQIRWEVRGKEKVDAQLVMWMKDQPETSVSSILPAA